MRNLVCSDFDFQFLKTEKRFSRDTLEDLIRKTNRRKDLSMKLAASLENDFVGTVLQLFDFEDESIDGLIEMSRDLYQVSLISMMFNFSGITDIDLEIDDFTIEVDQTAVKAKRKCKFFIKAKGQCSGGKCKGEVTVGVGGKF